MNLKKILPYLLLNIAVSAITTLAVILIWNAAHPPVASTTSLDGLLSSTAQPTAIVLPPLDEKTIEIQSVFLPGELNYEKISLKNVGADPINLVNWTLSNSEGDDLVLPELTLYPNGAVDVYSRAGINTAVELFWNASHAIWRPGGTAVLLDSAGEERSSYLTP
jgi:hypothetical protein